MKIGDKVRIIRVDDRAYNEVGDVVEVSGEFVKVANLPSAGEIIKRVGKTFRSRNVEIVSE